MVTTHRLSAGLWPAAALSLLVALGLAGPAGAFTQRGAGVVTALRGQVAVSHAPEVATRENRPPQEALKFRDDVFFRDTIDTQRDSAAKFLLKGRSVFTVRELSRVELREDAVPAAPGRTRSVVSLLSGALRALVQRDLRPQDELSIQTPNAVSAVRGTTVVLEVFRPGESVPALPAAEAPQGPPTTATDPVTRGYVVDDGPLEVDGQQVPQGSGFEKVGNRPLRIFRYLPDYVTQLTARFAIAPVTGPLGALLQGRIVTTLAARAAEAGRVRRAGPAGEPSPIERSVNGLTALNNRDIVFSQPVSGIADAGGSLFLSPIVSSGAVTFGSSDVVADKPFNVAFGQFTGTIAGRVRLLGAPGTVSLDVNCPSCKDSIGSPAPIAFRSTLMGSFGLQGTTLVGTGGGPASCSSGCAGAVTSATGTFAK